MEKNQSQNQNQNQSQNKINFYQNNFNNINDFEIVVMSENDLSAVTEIENSVANPSWKLSHFRDSFDDKNNTFCWVMKSKYNKNQVIGFALVMLILDEAHLLNIAIREEFRGKGLAAKFLKFMFEFVAKKSATTMFLEVRFFNETAKKLYQSFGFQQIGLRKKYYFAKITNNTPDGKEDAIIMSKKII